MEPKYHILYGAFFALSLYHVGLISPFSASLVFLASFLIDVDHYLWYVFKTGSLDLRKAVTWMYKKRDKDLSSSYKFNEHYTYPLFVLHWWLVSFILLFVGLFYSWVFMIGLGFFFHLILDAIEITLYPSLSYHKFFLWNTLKENKHRKDVFSLIQKV